MKKCSLLLGLLMVSTIMFAQRKGDYGSRREAG